MSKKSRKSLRDLLRLKRNEMEELRCKYCGSLNIVRFGHYKGVQRYFCNSCKRKFTLADTLHKMKTPIPVIADALSSYYGGMSLDNIVENLNQQYRLRLTGAGIYNWIVRFSKEAVERTKDLKPKVGDVWIADETVLKIGGKNLWHFDIIDSQTRFVLATHVSRSRTIADVRKLLEKATAKADKIPKVIITDKLASYIDGIELTYGADTRHTQSSPFENKELSTNLIERWHGTLKDRFKTMRGLGKPETAQILLDGFLFYYNFLRPHESLNDKTPAEVAQVKSPYRNWLDLIRANTKQTHQVTILEDYQKIIPVLRIRPQLKSKAKPRLRISTTTPSITQARIER